MSNPTHQNEAIECRNCGDAGEVLDLRSRQMKPCPSCSCELCGGMLEHAPREAEAERCEHCGDRRCWSCCPAPSPFKESPSDTGSTEQT